MKHFKTLYTLFLAISLNAQAQIHEYEPGVTPLFFYGEMDKVREVKNLTPSKDGVTLDLDLEENGFVLNTKRKIGLNSTTGIELTEDLSIPPFGAAIGLAPLVHSYASFITKVKTKNEAEKKMQIIPISKNHVDEMSIGDSARFQLVGGVTFYATLGTFGLNTKAKAISSGGFQCYIEKLTNNELYVELKKVKDKGLSFQAQITVPNAEISNIKRKANGFRYLINYKSEIGMEAYKAVLSGRLNLIEEKYLDNVNVIKLSEVKNDKERSEKSYGFGIPFFSLLRYTNTRQLQNGEEIIIDKDDQYFQTHYALSLKRRDSRLFGYKKIFETAFLVSYEGEKEFASKLNMQFFFQHFINKNTSEKLTEVRDSLIQFTGLNKFLNFKVIEKEKLKFAKVQFSLKLGKKITDSIIYHPEDFVFYYLTLKGQDSKTDRVINKIIDSLTSEKLNPKSIAQIGQMIWESPKLFSHTMNLVKMCGGELGFEVSGLRISRLVKNESFSETEECSSLLSTQK